MKFNEIPQFISSSGYEINMPLDFLENKIQEWIKDDYYNLQLNPDFQRGHVWTKDQQISFVEYYFRGGTSGRVLYFNKPSWNHEATTNYDDFVIVDGLQRLTALRRFLSEEIQIFGQYLKEFGQRIRMARSCNNLKLNINTLQTKAEILEWYLQMNTGGTVHTDQEITKVKKLLQETKIGV